MKTSEDIDRMKRELVRERNKVMASKEIEPNRNLMPMAKKPQEQKKEAPPSGSIPAVSHLPKKRNNTQQWWN